ncbi:nucleotidyltransferase family protein [Halorarum salinum]|uniref:Nucleotidyltransferase domain-containing protein n=1 Tax=Halorarum salinum TaxID=2743089 RepID=A0A7D5LCR8_9EURY|nr:hypothetical protein [Halobaculum salinum]QLG63514.1 hypothetical protein HUG12_17990 [Halobaculum salinum]
MGLSATQETVLDELVGRVPDGVTWCVFGSAAAALHGHDVEPSDIDVFTTEAGAERIRSVFPDAFVGTKELGVSQIDEYRMRGEEVEVVYSVSAKGNQEPLVDLADSEIGSSDGRGVPVLPVRPLVAAYRAMGKHDTAAELAEWFGIESD